MYSLSFKPYMYSTITVGTVVMLLTFSDLLCKRQIPCRYIYSLDIVIVSTSWYLKEPAHLADWILILVTIDHPIFYACPHFLSVSERKSRNNSTSIFKRLFSYLYSCNVFAGFLPRCFGMQELVSFFRSLFNKLCIGRSPVSPSLSSICFWVIPCSNISLICGNKSFVHWYFLGIQLPPWYGTLILPHQGGFCLLSVFNGLVHRAERFFITSRNIACKARCKYRLLL